MIVEDFVDGHDPLLLRFFYLATFGGQEQEALIFGAPTFRFGTEVGNVVFGAADSRPAAVFAHASILFMLACFDLRDYFFTVTAVVLTL